VRRADRNSPVARQAPTTDVGLGIHPPIEIEDAGSQEVVTDLLLGKARIDTHLEMRARLTAEHSLTCPQLRRDITDARPD
jgi:hypothetical protein